MSDLTQPENQRSELMHLDRINSQVHFAMTNVWDRTENGEGAMATYTNSKIGELIASYISYKSADSSQPMFEISIIKPTRKTVYALHDAAGVLGHFDQIRIAAYSPTNPETSARVTLFERDQDAEPYDVDMTYEQLRHFIDRSGLLEPANKNRARKFGRGLFSFGKK